MKIRSKELRADLVFGLVAGLGAGLAGGLVFGLVFGLVAGLLVGLAGGLVAGLGAGLVFGLGAGLGSGIVAGLFQGEYGLMIIPTLIVWVIVAEIVYIIQARLTKTRYDSLEMVALKKLEALFDSGIIGFNIINIVWLVQNYTVPWNTVYMVLRRTMVIILIILVCIALVMEYLFLNQGIANMGKEDKKVTKKKGVKPKKRGRVRPKGSKNKKK